MRAAPLPPRRPARSAFPRRRARFPRRAHRKAPGAPLLLLRCHLVPAAIEESRRGPRSRRHSPAPVRPRPSPGAACGRRHPAGTRAPFRSAWSRAAPTRRRARGSAGSRTTARSAGRKFSTAKTRGSQCASPNRAAQAQECSPRGRRRGSIRQSVRRPSLISASMSSIRFGASAVITSQPPALTATSSSMRTPMLCKRSGTSGAARI